MGYPDLLTRWRDSADEYRATAERLFPSDPNSLMRESLIEQAAIYDRCAAQLEDVMRLMGSR